MLQITVAAQIHAHRWMLIISVVFLRSAFPDEVGAQSFAWARDVGVVEFGQSGGWDVVTDAAGTVYSVGDLFVARYGFDGAFMWARGAGGGSGHLCIARDLATDAAGVYATGFISGRVDFSGDGMPELQRGQSMFVARYGPAGTFEEVWAPDAATTPRGARAKAMV